MIGSATLDRERRARRGPTRLPAFAAVVVLVFGLVGSIPAPASAAPLVDCPPEAGACQVSPTEIGGFVSVRGCTPEATDFDIRAVPLGLAAFDTEPVFLDPRQTHIRARVRSTGDRHLHRFLISGVRPGLAYGLSVSLPPSPVCPRVFFSSPSNGFVAGGDGFVSIEGLGVTTTLEVRSAAGNWVGMDALDSTDAATSTRTFRWRSVVAGVVGGELQVSTKPFPNDDLLSACDEPSEGVVHRQPLTLSGSDTSLTAVDFHEVLAREAIGDTAYRLLRSGAPVYVRVVPQDLLGPVCDAREAGIPGWSVFGPPVAAAAPQPPQLPAPVLEPGAGHLYSPPYIGGDRQGHPTYGEKAYKVIEPHPLPAWERCQTNSYQTGDSAWLRDPLGCLYVNSRPELSGTTLQPTAWFFIVAPRDSGGGSSFFGSLGSSFGALVTGAVEAAGVGVDFAAGVYNGVLGALKAFVYEWVSNIPGVGELCNEYPDKCKAAISTGVSIALTSMGLPPSAPNWSELKQEGVAYLAAEIGEQVESETGVPSEVTEEVVKRIAQHMLDEFTARRGGTDSRYNWVIPYTGFEPASIVVEVQKDTTEPLPVDVYLVGGQTRFLLGATIPLPRTFPSGNRMRIPMVRPPDTSAIPAPRCRASFYTTPTIQCIAFLPPSEPPICQYQTNADYSTRTWRTDDNCTIYRDLVAIYYRDAWIAQKLNGTSCDLVGAATLLDVDGRWTSDPDYSFFVGGWVRPMQAAALSETVPRYC